MKTKFGSIIVDGRGKIGGHVASKNRSGSYLRTKVTPVNPKTSFQTAIRNRLAGLATGWAGLTDAQRGAWNAAVDKWKKSNIFGDVVISSGFNLYCRLNSNILMAAGTAITTPAVPVAIPPITTLTLTGAVGTPALSLVFAPTPVATNYTLMIEATPALAPGKTFVKNMFRIVSTVAAAGTSPKNLLADWNTKFGTLTPAGNKVWVRVTLVNKLTGQAGIPVVTSCVLAA